MKRILLAISLTLIAFCVLADGDKEEPPVKVSGELDLRGVWISKSADSMIQGLNAGAGGFSGGSTGLDYTKFTLNINARIKKNVEFFLQLQTRIINGDVDSDKVISNDDLIRFPSVDQIKHPLKQAYLKISDFPVKGLSITAGEQNIEYRLRPGGESFAFNLEESQSPFTGINVARTAMRNFVGRKLIQPVGVKVRLDRDWWAIDAFGLDYTEGAIAGHETLYGIFGEVLPIPKLSIMGLVTKIKSAQILDSGLWLAGGGIDYNANEWLEVFGEAYMNFGQLASGVKKSGAYALNTGLHIQLTDKYWAEGAFSYATGDKNPADGEDSAFQSYEGVNTLTILQNNELGLNIATNYNALIFTFGAGPFSVFKDKNILLRADLGFLRFNEPLFGPAGVKFLTDSNKNLGTELGFGATFEYNDNLSFFAKSAYLFDSNALRAITGTGSSALFYIGTDIKF